MSFPTPHGDKLQALLANDKLPSSDHSRVARAIDRYKQWVAALQNLQGNFEEVLKYAVDILNDYRNFLDLEVIFDSAEDFLYRQKGQLKPDNTVVEEFLPHLVAKAFPQSINNFNLGPQSCFAALYFTSTLRTAEELPQARVRSKDQDFTI